MFEHVTLEVLRRPGRTVDDLRADKEVVDHLKGDLDNGELSPEEALERLRREAPELATLADVLPKTRSELYAALSLILSTITLYLAANPKRPSPSAFDPAPKTLSKREMRRRIERADAVHERGDGQRVLLQFERGESTKTEEWAALHSWSPMRPDAAYTLVREERQDPPEERRD